MAFPACAALWTFKYISNFRTMIDPYEGIRSSPTALLTSASMYIDDLLAVARDDCCPDQDRGIS